MESPKKPMESPKATSYIEIGADTGDTKKEETEEVDDGPNPTFMDIMRLSKPEWPALGFSIILMIGTEVIGLLPPLLFADAYDAVVAYDLQNSEKRHVITDVMIKVFILHVAGFFFGFIRGCVMGAAGERIVARLRVNLYSCILRQEIGFFDRRKTGELVSRLGSDTTIIQTVTSSSLPESVIGILKVLATIGLMFLISWKLTVIIAGVAIVIFILCLPFGKWLGGISKKYQDALGTAQTSSTEAIGAMRTVRAFVAEQLEADRYKKSVGDPSMFKFWWPWKSKDAISTYRFGVLKAFGTTSFTIFTFGTAIGTMYASVWYGFELVLNDEITFGRLMAYQTYIFGMAIGLAQVGGHMTQVLQVMGATKRIFELLGRVPAILPNPKGCITLPKSIRGDVVFEDVTFSYPTRPEISVIEEFSLKVPANSTAALVGSSGCGKSTVVSLIQRFYDVQNGCISIDGHDIRNYHPDDLRSFIGFVQQEPVLFGLTVRENICYGVRRKVLDEEIEAVCKQANAHKFISGFPEKYDTLVGERGVRLSGGQKQRVCIARALLVNPRVLLLDEATSALDAEAEYLVQQAIDKLMVGRTTIIVAHRLSTVRDADQIVVMDEHRIVDVGTHKELMVGCQKYQELIKRQIRQASEKELKHS